MASKLLTVVAMGAGALFLFYHFRPGGSVIQDAAPADAHKPACQEAVLYTGLVDALFKKIARDPDSVRTEGLTPHNDRAWNGKHPNVVCGAVNMKNGFGGYTGFTDFVLVEDTGEFALNSASNNGRFVRMWNTLCAGVHKSCPGH